MTVIKYTRQSNRIYEVSIDGSRLYERKIAETFEEYGGENAEDTAQRLVEKLNKSIDA